MNLPHPANATATNRWKWLGIAVLLALVSVIVGIGAANWWVVYLTHGRIIPLAENLPANDVALVLGTSPRLAGGWRNPFFDGRIATAAALYRSGRVRHLLVSGDNRRRSYDEPTAMREALLALGVPATAITLDYAGFRTLDSMARARKVFGQDRITVVTDDFHQPRALFLAGALGLDAVGIPSASVPLRWSLKTRTREIFSRVKACLDIYVLHTQPHFYGPPVKIELAQRSDG